MRLEDTVMKLDSAYAILIGAYDEAIQFAKSRGQYGMAMELTSHRDGAYNDIALPLISRLTEMKMVPLATSISKSMRSPVKKYAGAEYYGSKVAEVREELDELYDQLEFDARDEPDMFVAVQEARSILEESLRYVESAIAQLTQLAMPIEKMIKSMR